MFLVIIEALQVAFLPADHKKNALSTTGGHRQNLQYREPYCLSLEVHGISSILKECHFGYKKNSWETYQKIYCNKKGL